MEYSHKDFFLKLTYGLF